MALNTVISAWVQLLQHTLSLIFLQSCLFSLKNCCSIDYCSAMLIRAKITSTIEIWHIDLSIVHCIDDVTLNPSSWQTARSSVPMEPFRAVSSDLILKVRHWWRISSWFFSTLVACSLLSNRACLLDTINNHILRRKNIKPVSQCRNSAASWDKKKKKNLLCCFTNCWKYKLLPQKPQ